jgi:2',3'-cyclic-nucleotide 2'-phosphodiesterase / 3'-nucleotidase
MRKISSLLTILSFFFLFPAFSQQKADVVIKFIETSDVHGSIFPYDFINKRPESASLANAYTYIKQERSKKDQEVVLLDDGDILQGQPTVYYYNFYKTDTPHICASVMNFMKYDAGAVGNHDIEAGHLVYDRLVKEFAFPWLAANVTIPCTTDTYFKPYTIIIRKGIKIAVLGMCTPGVPTWLPHALWDGMQFDDMIKTAQKWIPVIKEKEKPDLIVGLFHSGTDYTYDDYTIDSDKNPNASKLVAEKVEGFDVIFTGHDHKLTWMQTNNPSRKPVYLAGPSGHCINLVSVAVKLSYNPATSAYNKTIRMDTIWTKNYGADPEFIDKFKQDQAEISGYISEKVGTFTEGISTKPSMLGDSKFVDLIHTIQLQLTGAQISFAAPLTFNATIKKGNIYMSDMFNLYKYENFLCTIKMTGREINNYLEYSYSKWFEKMADSTGQLIKFKKDAHGNYVKNNKGELITETNTYNYDNAAGIKYVVNINASDKKYVTITSMANGSPFYMDSTYTVAINSYRTSGGGGHITTGAGIAAEEIPNRIITSTNIDLRYYLKEWIMKKGTVKPATDNNWIVVPASWYEAARKRSALELLKTKEIGE